MNKTQAMRELKAMGTAQNRKVYARHGASEPMFGVSYANLGKLKRAIKTDHELALGLWSTGNHDARILATMIADPAAMTAKELDHWASSAADHVVCFAVSKVVGESPHAKKIGEKWVRSKKEFISAAGWNVICILAERPEILPDAELEAYLETIEAEIHRAPNRTRYSMNGALIAIGLRPKLKRAAIAAAKRIGPVEVDHGETGCKTPDAVTYIEKATTYHGRKKKAAAKKKATKKKVTRKTAKATARKKATKKAGAAKKKAKKRAVRARA